MVTWPDASTTLLKTTSDANGFYSFGNLLLDERYDGVGSGEPTFTLSAAIPAGSAVSWTDQGSDDALDSDGAEAGSASAVTIGAPNSPLAKGAVNAAYDLGFTNPTAVTISELVASPLDNAIQVAWQTYSELDILGFKLYRAESLDGSAR